MAGVAPNYGGATNQHISMISILISIFLEIWKYFFHIFMVLNKTKICFEQMEVTFQLENATLVFTTFRNIQYVQRAYLASETYFDTIKYSVFGRSEGLE